MLTKDIIRIIDNIIKSYIQKNLDLIDNKQTLTCEIINAMVINFGYDICYSTIYNYVKITNSYLKTKCKLFLMFCYNKNIK